MSSEHTTILGLYLGVCLVVAIFNIVNLWMKAEDREITHKSAARRTLLLPFWFLFWPLVLFVCSAKWLISTAIWGKK